jgi:hypothetical protein
VPPLGTSAIRSRKCRCGGRWRGQRRVRALPLHLSRCCLCRGSDEAEDGGGGVVDLGVRLVMMRVGPPPWWRLTTGTEPRPGREREMR